MGVPTQDDRMWQQMSENLLDDLDEELELEWEDGVQLPPAIRQQVAELQQDQFPRRRYFVELFRLQRELVKLQDWVVANHHRMVIVFEGRDAAGKGGVIKRITQRLNPRVARVVALPAPNDRERTQWYFQRYVTHLDRKSVV